MIPRQYLIPYLVSNAVAVVALVLAFRRPSWVRYTTVVIFLWAAFTNTRIALFHPGDYQTFAELTFSSLYRQFIEGWFRENTPAFLIPIAAGQLAISLLLIGRRPARRLGLAGAVLFLLAIAPLGVGSAFPFSVIYSAALVVMEHHLEATKPDRHTIGDPTRAFLESRASHTTPR
jgi:hypothetical protein